MDEGTGRRAKFYDGRVAQDVLVMIRECYTLLARYPPIGQGEQKCGAEGDREGEHCYWVEKDAHDRCQGWSWGWQKQGFIPALLTEVRTVRGSAHG